MSLSVIRNIYLWFCRYSSCIFERWNVSQVIYEYCLNLIVCYRKISKYDPAAVQDHILIFSCSIHSNYFYTILTKLFFQIRKYCLFLINGGHIFLPPAFRFWKVTQYLTSASLQSNILSPSKTFRLVTNIWPPFINNKHYIDPI